MISSVLPRTVPPGIARLKEILGRYGPLRFVTTLAPSAMSAGAMSDGCTLIAAAVEAAPRFAGALPPALPLWSLPRRSGVFQRSARAAGAGSVTLMPSDIEGQAMPCFGLFRYCRKRRDNRSCRQLPCGRSRWPRWPDPVSTASPAPKMPSREVMAVSFVDVEIAAVQLDLILLAEVAQVDLLAGGQHDVFRFDKR